MGWQTDVITQVVFNKKTYNSIFEVEDDIDKCNDSMSSIVRKLVTYSTARPEDILLNRKEATLSDIQLEVTELLKDFRDDVIEKYKLQCLKDNFKCRQGDFIDNEDAQANIREYLKDNFILTEED